MKRRTFGRELLFWAVLLGIVGLGLYLIHTQYGEPYYFFMDTMPAMFCVGALVPLLTLVFRYLPKKKGLRVAACLVSVVLAIAIGIGTLYACYSDDKINNYYWKMFASFSGKAADEKALLALGQKGKAGELAVGEVEYGEKLVFCQFMDNETNPRVYTSFEQARTGQVSWYEGVDPQRLARSLKEADTAVFFYGENTLLYSVPWEERNTVTGAIRRVDVPFYGTDTTMFAVDLHSQTACAPVSVAYREPEKSDNEHYRESGFSGGMDWSAVFRTVLGDDWHGEEA